MRRLFQTRQLQIVAAVVLLVCLLALLVPQGGAHGGLVAGVLFFPLFLFGLLDLALLLRGAVLADEIVLPQAPVLDALFQRPPPAFD
jgi:hypothetical protein